MNKSENIIGQIYLNDKGGVSFHNFCLTDDYHSVHAAMVTMLDAFYEEAKRRINRSHADNREFIEIVLNDSSITGAPDNG